MLTQLKSIFFIFSLIVLVSIVLSLSLLLSASFFYQIVFAASPSFSREEIEDKKYDWLDVWRGRSLNTGPTTTDIQVVNYYSDGKFLNATLWLDKFNETGPPDRRLNYGMYIDSDFNNKTGIEGIDYKVEIQWNNQTNTWTRVFEEWSTNGKSRTLDVRPNYTGFFEKVNTGNDNNKAITTTAEREEAGGDYVNLYVDLNKMFSPNRYKVLFYAEEVKGLKWIMDYAKWVYIPPPEFVITTIPSSVSLRQGDTKTIEIQVNSTKGFEPYFHLYSISGIPSSSSSSSFPSSFVTKRDEGKQYHQGEQQQQYIRITEEAGTDATSINTTPAGEPNDVKLDFRFNKLRIPSQGEAITPVTISSVANSLISPHTLFIFGNFTFPSEEFFAQPLFSSQKIKIPTENVITQSSLTVSIEEALTPIDQISQFWNKLGGFINFIYAIGGAIATWLFSNYIKKRKNDKDSNNDMTKNKST